ncbi:MAG: hypothetical protein BWY71_00864 [Planctomycetes bacterium ADurb.Bin412]|nr:MAG: hypothetical protein BWY71_00864 [Planctomycetes bacterium ADurb.Bin412]
MYARLIIPRPPHEGLCIGVKRGAGRNGTGKIIGYCIAVRIARGDLNLEHSTFVRRQFGHGDKYR